MYGSYVHVILVTTNTTLTQPLSKVLQLNEIYNNNKKQTNIGIFTYIFYYIFQ